MVGFVILQYNNSADTIKCVDSLLGQKNNDIQVIIVDNGSREEENQAIVRKYSNCGTVKIVLNGSNVGFAAGNNIGCRYAVNNILNLNLLCVFNNDTWIDDDEWVDKLVRTYKKTNFDMLAPYINDMRTYRNQNPFYGASNLKEAKALLKRAKNQAKISRVNNFLSNVYAKIFKPRLTGVTMHGAAMIFSRSYLDRYSEVVPELTFMYCEEYYILHRQVVDKLKIIFDYDLLVNHINGASTTKNHKSQKDKNKFYYDYVQKGFEELVQIFKATETT